MSASDNLFSFTFAASINRRRANAEGIASGQIARKAIFLELAAITGALWVSFFIALDAQGQSYSFKDIAGLWNTPAYADGTNSAAFFNNPQGIAVDGAGNVFVADSNNYVIRKISPVGTNWVATTISGQAGTRAFTDGANSNARFYNISSLQLDGLGNLYAQDYNPGSGYYYIRKIAPIGTNWVVTTIYKLWASGSGWAVDPGGNFYTASNYAVIQLTPIMVNGISSQSNFLTKALAGFPGLSGSVDGVNIVARFYSPGVFGIDSLGAIYLSDINSSSYNRTIRKVSPSGGDFVTTTLITESSTYSGFDFNTLDYAGNVLSSPVSIAYNTYGVFCLRPGIWNGALYAISTVLGAASAGTDGAIYVCAKGASVILKGVPDSQASGSLQVALQSNDAVNAGAVWRVDAGLWQTNGALVTNLMSGSNHVLSFAPVYGWSSPSNQWVTISSNTTTLVTVEYTQQFGSLQVTLTPSFATDAGARWALDNGEWQSSGLIVSNVTVGPHVISFLPTIGFITPSDQNITVVSGQTTNISATYVALGSVQVTINPTNAASAGAQWALDGGALQGSGAVVSNLALGAHTISYAPLNSWIAPSNQVVNVLSGQTTNVTATYIALGSLQVFITPIGAVSAGARWQLDGGAWQASGSVVSNVVAGSHTVVFTNISGWTTPISQTVTVSLSQTTVATGVYAQQFGNLQVVLSPAGSVSAGAQWQLDGGAWLASGATLTNVPVGSHALGYAAISGWTAPTNQTVSILSNQTTRLTAVYQGQGSLQVALMPSGAILSGAQWQVDGGEWLNSGATVTGLSRSTHTVSYKAASGWVAPASQAVSVLANQTAVTNGVYTGLGYGFSTIAGTAGIPGFAEGVNGAARFDTPVGMAADASGNLFIADTGNSVIRKLTLAAEGWVSSTVAGLAGSPGNADGTNSEARFDYPTGVAVDTNGTVYVADQVNSTVRKITSAGTNWVVSTIAGLAGNYGSANGTNSVARFYYPAGVAVDAAGSVYVADQINSTIRKLTLVGSNNWSVTTIAGTAGANGSTDSTNSAARFYWPSDLCVGGSGVLFVADTFNNTIRKIVPTGSNYAVSTICGVAGVSGSVDGTNSGALLDGPGGISLDSLGNLFVADSYGSVIRKITPVGTNWVVNTIGGLAYATGTADGTNSAARFNTPYGVCVNAGGLVFVADTENATIRAGTPVYPMAPAPSLVPLSRKTNALGFCWSALPGIWYQVQYKTNLTHGAWMDLGAATLATDWQMQFTEVPPVKAERFYRVVVLP